MPKSNPYLSIPAFFLLVLSLLLISPATVSAREASFYQKELSPASVRLLFEMQEFNRSGDYQKGLERFAAFSASRKKEPPALLNFIAANLNFQLARYPESVQLYRLVLKQASEFYTVYENLGMALMMTENYRQAAEILLKAAVVLPEKRQKLKYQAAIAYLYGEDFKKSRSLLHELLAANPEPPADWLKALIQAHWRLDESKAALEVGGRLVDSYPETIEHWRLYGQLALSTGEYQTALSAYKVLQSSGRITVKEQKLMARIYQQLQLPKAAAAAWENVFTKDAPSRQELETLVVLYRQSGQVERALETLDRLQKLAPESATAFDVDFRRGKILYYAGRYQEAYDIFTKLETITEEDGYQHLLAGYCAWNENNFPAAAASWQKAANYPVWRERSLNLLRTLEPFNSD
ncbi:MAG: tetratricopeptide repeat protein [Pseudomonadota bacterium]|nr:tetratricopeptide repeat protein [Pseudomonadota bacterium]